MNYITSFSHIRNRCVFGRGEMFCRDIRGSLDDFLESAFQALAVNYPKFYKMDASSKLGFIGVEILLRDVPLHEDYKPEQVGLISGSGFLEKKIFSNVPSYHAMTKVRNVSTP